MSNPPAAASGAARQAAIDAAMLLLGNLGISPADLTAAPQQRPELPTFADYVPVVSASVTTGTRRAYGSPRSTRQPPRAATIPSWTR
jgi:hypothetical protein